MASEHRPPLQNTRHALRDNQELILSRLRGHASRGSRPRQTHRSETLRAAPHSNEIDFSIFTTAPVGCRYNATGDSTTLGPAAQRRRGLQPMRIASTALGPRSPREGSSRRVKSLQANQGGRSWHARIFAHGLFARIRSWMNSYPKSHLHHRYPESRDARPAAARPLGRLGTYRRYVNSVKLTLFPLRAIFRFNFCYHQDLRREKVHLAEKN